MYLETVIRRVISSRTARAIPNIHSRNIMKGPGSREFQNKGCQGMTAESVKRHYSLIPIFCIIAFALVTPTLYCIRLATKSIDVNIAKRKEPWNDYTAKEFKFFAPRPGPNLSTPSPRPNFETDDTD